MKRILIRAPNWIGDQILAYPFYRALRLANPKAWIGVVCTEWVSDLQFKGCVDEVFVIPKKKGDSRFRSFFRILSFSRKLRKKGPWDLGITLPNSFGSALLLRLSGARIRRGYDADFRAFLLTDALMLETTSTSHRAQAYLGLLHTEERGGFEGQDYWSRSGEREFDVYRNWPEIMPVDPPSDPYFVVAPGSNADSRRWGAARFAELIGMIQSKYRLKCVVVGGPAEKALANAMMERGVQLLDFTARGPAPGLWKVFRNSAFSICNDSGLAHLASLCGSRVQIVWGAGDPKRTRPIGPGLVQLKMNPLPCWPCERNVCRLEESRKNQCLTGIHPAHILEEVEHGFLSV